MKKTLFFLVVLVGLLTITGCDSTKNEKNNDNSNQEQKEEQPQVEKDTYDINDFESDVKALISDVNVTEMAAELVGAESGIKLTSNDSKVELYKFDKNSSTYKTAEENQQLTMEGFGNFDATVQNGYAMIIDENFPNKADVENLFNKLN